jgi:glycerate kinase
LPRASPARVSTEIIPLGNGGQGTAVALFEALGYTGDWHGATVAGPLGHRVPDAAFLLLPDGLAIMDSS